MIHKQSRHFQAQWAYRACQYGSLWTSCRLGELLRRLCPALFRCHVANWHPDATPAAFPGYLRSRKFMALWLMSIPQPRPGVAAVFSERTEGPRRVKEHLQLDRSTVHSLEPTCSLADSSANFDAIHCLLLRAYLCQKTRVCLHAGAVVACPSFAAGPVLLRLLLLIGHCGSPAPQHFRASCHPRLAYSPLHVVAVPRLSSMVHRGLRLSAGNGPTARASSPPCPVSPVCSTHASHTRSACGSPGSRETLCYTCATDQLSYSRTGVRCCMREENQSTPSP